MSEEIIVGLDLGSRAIRMAAGQLVQTGEKQKLQIIGAAEVESQGITAGLISNFEDAVSAISMCREKLERLIGIPIEHVWVGLNTVQAACQESRGSVGVIRHNGEIDASDMERALEQARMVAMPSNFDILHVIPRGFSVDGQMSVKDPSGMTGIRLEVNTLIVQMPTAHIKNATKCIYRTELDIDELVLGILANAEAVVTPKQKDLGVVVIDIGDTTTGIVAFEGGDVLRAAILPIGSFHITRDIVLCAKIPLDIAEEIKIKFGCALSKTISKKEEVSLSEDEESANEAVNRKYLAEIIEARVEEIFSDVNAELQKIGKVGNLPGGAIITGGGAKLEGIAELAKKILRVPAALGYPVDVASVSEKISDLSFVTAIGLVKWGSNYADEAGNGGFADKFKGFFDKARKAAMGGIKTIWK
jgi:cell division protein FtsA